MKDKLTPEQLKKDVIEIVWEYSNSDMAFEIADKIVAYLTANTEPEDVPRYIKRRGLNSVCEKCGWGISGGEPRCVNMNCENLGKILTATEPEDEKNEEYRKYLESMTEKEYKEKFEGSFENTEPEDEAKHIPFKALDLPYESCPCPECQQEASDV